MKRIVRWGLAAVAVLVVAVLALPFLLPTSVYKEQIIEQTRLATGRQLTIDGDLNISIWPSLGVEVHKVRFANAEGASEPDMATMESLVVGAELWPLLAGALKVTEIRLVNPVINLEIDSQGRGNWLFAPQGAPAAASGDAPPPSAQTSSADFSFRDVTLSGGVLTYRDQREGTAQRVEAINASVKLPSLDQPMAFDGGLTWNNEAITIAAVIANPRALSTGGKSALTAKIDGEVMNATFDGEVDAKTSAVEGKIDFATASARRLAAWAGVELPKVKGFGPMKLSGRIEADGGRVAFKETKLSLDGMNGSGNLALETARAKPHVKGDFTLDRLDLNAYASAGGGTGRSGAGGSVAPWSTAPIDFAALNMVDADFDFAVNALSVGGLKIGRSALGFALAGGKLRANLKKLALYGGNGTGTIALDGSGGAPRFGVDVTISGVQAAPFLTDLAGFNRLEGSGTIVAKVTGGGNSQRAWMNSLGGSAQIKFVDGAIRGINLAEIARTIQSALTGAAVGGAAKTDFAELSGTFAIRQGIAANKDLKLLNPFVRLNGAGIINIGEQTLDYRVEPKAVRSIKGQGGRTDLAGIGIPFRIKGPWRNPSYSPDLSGVIPGVVDTIIKGDNPLDSIKDGILGRRQEKGDDKAQDEKSKGTNPLDSLKDVFGGDR